MNRSQVTIKKERENLWLSYLLALIGFSQFCRLYIETMPQAPFIIEKYPTLVLCLLMALLGCGQMIYGFLKYAEKIKGLSTIEELKTAKLKLYRSQVLIELSGIVISGWLILDRRIYDGLMVLSIMLISPILVYFFDWKRVSALK